MATWSVLRGRFNHRLVDKTEEVSLLFSAINTALNLTLEGNCLIHTIKINIPNWTNNVTMKLTIEDEDGDVIYESDTLNRNTNYVLTNLKDFIAVSGDVTFKYTLSGAPGGEGGTVKTSIYCI